MTRLEPDFEKTLRRYVLGSLEEERRLQLEERLVKDSNAFEALGVVEDELTEEYLDGTLSTTEKRGFKRHYLSAPDRARMPELFSALRARASVSAAEPPRVSRWDPARWFRPVSLPPAWLGAAAAILVLSLAANAWLALTPTSPGPPGSSVPTFTLAAGVLRGEGSLARVTVPPEAEVVRLALVLPGDEYPLYDASLYDVDGNEIWAQSKLKATETQRQVVLSLFLPTSLLPYDDYQVKVSGVTEQGERERLATYTFRAITN
jgi:hypothetical protein